MIKERIEGDDCPRCGSGKNDVETGKVERV